MQPTSSEKFPVFFQKFRKAMGELRVNETKLTSRYYLIVNSFALGCKEEYQKNRKAAIFPEILRRADLSSRP